MVSVRKASSTPPRAAMPADSPKACSLAASTLMPREAAARSLARIAIICRPVRPRRRLATARAQTTKAASATRP